MSKNRIKYFESDSVLEEFYNALANQDEKKLRRVHIPRSDVFYVRSAVEAYYGRSFTLKHVEDAMRAEGWKEKDE